MEVTIGGDRVGSGKKMKAHLHNYNRSTHNLSETFASSMASGVLYPALCKLGMRGDSFDISINADCRTIPTVGPLFGSYKMQIDVYQCPVRLYQGYLHNNPAAIGLKMGQVKFPVLQINSAGTKNELQNFATNTSSLLHYLGLSGIGIHTNSTTETIKRKINAIPALSYYDIFKTYYANKQEEKAYFISGQKTARTVGTTGQKWGIDVNYNYTENNFDEGYEVIRKSDLVSTIKIKIPIVNLKETVKAANDGTLNTEVITIVNEDDDATYRVWTLNDLFNYIDYRMTGNPNLPIVSNGIANIYTEYGEINNINSLMIVIELDSQNISSIFDYIEEEALYIYVYSDTENIDVKTNVVIKDFNLSNIDDMRYDLLSAHTLGTAYEIKNDGNAYYPYKVLVETDLNDIMYNTYPMNGLVLKTYQNDIFNNWLNTEWIEGENSITELTKVAIVDGAFSMDSLNFAQKQYNMLNRIAVAGATYEDWQDVVYEEVKRRQIESPIFVGGMSQEVVFDEIVQTAPAEGDPLGTLGGRGKLANNKKGGKIHVKCDEACFIIALVSLTPRIYYTQGNEFYLTDVFSMDDMHKPPMDGIGFQDLIGERMAWFDTVITKDTATVAHRSKIGKLPAWIEYMTSYDRAHGDFAEDKAGYMILSRRYEHDTVNGGIKDATTYIDPQKYNYAFAYQNLDAQNFWVQIGFNIKARRLMSARLIPNV